MIFKQIVQNVVFVLHIFFSFVKIFIQCTYSEAVEKEIIKSTRPNRDAQLAEWRAKSNNLSNSEARTLATQVLDFSLSKCGSIT